MARFRRSLAWHIARRPGGLVALAIQYGHMRTTMSAGYAARGRGGIHEYLSAGQRSTLTSQNWRVGSSAGRQE